MGATTTAISVNIAGRLLKTTIKVILPAIKLYVFRDAIQTLRFRVRYVTHNFFVITLRRPYARNFKLDHIWGHSECQFCRRSSFRLLLNLVNSGGRFIRNQRFVVIDIVLEDLIDKLI